MTGPRQPSSLQKLVEAHGGYDRITPEAWKRFDEDTARWKAFVRDGGLHYGVQPPPRRFYDPVLGQCRCPDAGLGPLGHEYRETGKRGGAYVVVCLTCRGAVVPDFDRALREAQQQLNKSQPRPSG